MPMPAGATREEVISLLHDHDFILHMDPELSEYKEEPPADAAPGTKYYKTTHNMAAIPKPFWSNTVTFTCEMTNSDSGLKWVVHAPLGLEQESNWSVKESDGVYLVEDIIINCNRVLVGTVKNKCQESFDGNVKNAFTKKLTK